MGGAIAAPERILIIRPSSLGDVVRTVPALASLRRAYPGARIDWVVGEAFVDAVRHHPALTGIVVFPRRLIGEHLRRLRLGRVREWLATLREPRYDLALDLQGLLRSGVMCRATRAARRVGFADARELGWIGYNQKVRVPKGTHHVDRYLLLLREIGVEPVADMRLYSAPEDREAVARDARLGGRYVVIAPTTRGSGRAWPIERYAALVEAILARSAELGVERVVLVGLGSERGACAPVLSTAARDGRVVSLLGETGISRLMAVIERAALVVCNDSAAMHIAAAFGRPLVALLGPTRAQTSGPYGRAGDVISRLGEGERVRHRDVARASEVMRRIPVEDVVAACAARLGG